jgi:hypothetical protein
MTKERESFFLYYSTNKKDMFTQQSVYILGIVNLFLAAIAILCVVQAEDHPEYFSLVYIAVCIFIFYMGTILIIIILQITETYQEQQQRRERRRQQNQSLLQIQIPILTTHISSQLNAIIDESLNTPTKPKKFLSRSQTLPSTLSSYNPHKALSTSTLLSTLKDLNNTSSGLITASTHLALLSNHQPRFTTVHKNYQSFTFITSDHRHPS